MSEYGVASSGPVPDGGYKFGAAFQFVFHDPSWTSKILVGALFSVLSVFLIGAVFVAGYVVRLARRTMNSEQHPLPEWDDLQAILIDGLRGLAVYLGHMLAVALIFIPLLLAFGGALALSEHEDSLPHSIGLLVVIAIVVGLGSFVLMVLIVLCYIPAAMVRFIRTNSIRAAFEFSANAEFIRNNSSIYFLGLLTIILASFLAQLGIFLFCIGIFATTFWSSCVAGYVLGELARQDSDKSF